MRSSSQEKTSTPWEESGGDARTDQGGCQALERDARKVERDARTDQGGCQRVERDGGNACEEVEYVNERACFKGDSYDTICGRGAGILLLVGVTI